MTAVVGLEVRTRNKMGKGHKISKALIQSVNRRRQTLTICPTTCEISATSTKEFVTILPVQVQ